jgi:hypothetical protein
VVQVYEYGQHAGRPFFAMEYLDGGSLADRLRAGPVTPAGAAALVETVPIEMADASRPWAAVQDPDAPEAEGRLWLGLVAAALALLAIWMAVAPGELPDLTLPGSMEGM